MVIRLVLGTFALTAVLTGAISADAAVRNFGVSGFDRVRVDGPFKVRLTTGTAPFAKASGSQSGLDRVVVEVQGRTLVVRPERSSWGGYPGEAQGPVEISIGTHELNSAWLNGSGSLAIDKVKGLSFDLSVHGAGTVGIEQADVDQLRIAIAGTGSATLAGRAGKLTANIRGVSSLDGVGLVAKDARIGAEGPATVKVTVTNEATVNGAGVAAITLAGNPSCTARMTGSASLDGCR